MINFYNSGSSNLNYTKGKFNFRFMHSFVLHKLKNNYNSALIIILYYIILYYIILYYYYIILYYIILYYIILYYIILYYIILYYIIMTKVDLRNTMLCCPVELCLHFREAAATTNYAEKQHYQSTD